MCAGGEILSLAAMLAFPLAILLALLELVSAAVLGVIHLAA